MWICVVSRHLIGYQQEWLTKGCSIQASHWSCISDAQDHMHGLLWQLSNTVAYNISSMGYGYSGWFLYIGHNNIATNIWKRPSLLVSDNRRTRTHINIPYKWFPHNHRATLKTGSWTALTRSCFTRSTGTEAVQEHVPSLFFLGMFTGTKPEDN